MSKGRALGRIVRPFGYSPDRAGSWTRADALAYAGFLATVGGVLLAAGALVQARLKHLLLVVGLVLLGISLLLAMFVVPFLHPRGQEDDLLEFVVTDAGRGRFAAPLLDLASSGSPRVDAVIGASLARDLLVVALQPVLARARPVTDEHRFAVVLATGETIEGSSAGGDVATAAAKAIRAAERRPRGRAAREGSCSSGPRAARRGAGIAAAAPGPRAFQLGRPADSARSALRAMAPGSPAVIF